MGDVAHLPGGGVHERLASKVARWRTTTAAGAVLGALAMGLRDLLDPPARDGTVLVEDVPLDGEPHALDVALHPDEPTISLAVVRPWLRA